MQSLHGNCLIAYARHKYILTMVNGEYRYFNGGDLVFADASQIQVDKCVENFVLVSRDTLSLFLPMLKEEALKLHAHKKVPALLVHHCTRDIPVFQEVAQLSQNKNLRYAEMLRKRALIFALLSVFLEDMQFIPLLLNVLQPNMRTRVCTVINNNIAHEWTLARIASELLMSPSLLKKNCAKKVRHIHSCLLSVGCSVLYNLLLYMGFQLSELQCPVDITACRISFTFFEIIMG